MDHSRGVIDVLVETPQGSRSKYEYDHERRAMRLDRRLFSATVFPVDYGFVPDTEGADGEELDALVLTDSPTFSGCWVTARIVGVFWIEYGGDKEAKLVCVPDADPTWEAVADISDVPQHLRQELAHFFDVYKQLEPTRTPSAAGWGSREEGLEVLRRALEGPDRGE